ncbi:MAG: FkbM family methyltransferase [Acidobacteriota bacterium]
MIVARLSKLAQVVRSTRLAKALLFHGVAAAAEHRSVLTRDLATVVDIGANRGQFALAARRWAPGARVISFEPLPGPCSIFRKVFANDDRVKLHATAIGPGGERRTMHLSARDDSSSLLPISSVQTSLFPGTDEISTLEVGVSQLDKVVSADDLRPPSLLKLDVQGFEYEALKACESLLPRFRWVYCECSFIELYSGQKLASDVIALLAGHGFVLVDIRNPTFDGEGRCVQADLLFSPGEALASKAGARNNGQPAGELSERW